MTLTVAIPRFGTAAAWRDAARRLALAGVPPEAVLWRFGEGESKGEGDLFAGPAADLPQPVPARRLDVPRGFVEMAETVCWHADPERFARLYAFLVRLAAHPGLMADRADPGLARLREMEKGVRRCAHKMKAFVRFRDLAPGADGRRRFGAWFEPTHHTLEPTAPFFARRFADMDWTIATPDKTAVFAAGTLSFHAGAPRPELPEDGAEALWTTYFRNIFNPARLKVRAMASEMPRKYWKNLPEAAEIPDLVATAQARADEMREKAPTMPPARAARVRLPQPPDAPPPGSLAALRREVDDCTRCPLYAQATQGVPGEGPRDADLMVVGEQPGDQEDLAGRPFVGPAGQLLDRMMEEAGIDRSRVFVTNAVKHFKFTPRGKRRLHQNPDRDEISACRWWLEAEIRLTRPRLILALGGTAAESLTGSRAGILKRRGGVEPGPDGLPVFLTVHPSFLLRLPDPEAKARERARFLDDLDAVRRRLEQPDAA